jgi:Endonuclease/Exonuclease/phosphatase family
VGDVAEDRVTDWRRLVVGCHNVGRSDVGSVADLLAHVDAAGLQEMGDRADLRRELMFSGLLFVPTSARAQDHNPLVYRPSALELIRPVRFLLSDRQYAGPGAGGGRDKILNARWFVGGVFRHRQSGRRVVIGSVHPPASQWNPIRRRIALESARRIVAQFRLRRCPVIVTGDWNTPPWGRSVAPFRDGDEWRCARSRGGTHGRRIIDYVWWKAPARKMRLLAVRRARTGSDHMAVLVTFLLSRRER